MISGGLHNIARLVPWAGTSNCGSTSWMLLWIIWPEPMPAEPNGSSNILDLTGSPAGRKRRHVYYCSSAVMTGCYSMISLCNVTKLASKRKVRPRSNSVYKETRQWLLAWQASNNLGWILTAKWQSTHTPHNLYTKNKMFTQGRAPFNSRYLLL